MFYGLYRGVALSFGDAADDFYNGMAFFVIHGNDAFATKELALIYLVVFILMYISGPGKFSVDYLLGKELGKRRKS